MTFGPWITPDPATGSVVFASDQPRSIDVDSFGGTVEISPQQYGSRTVTNSYGDGIDRTQDMWDKLRGFNDVAGDTANIYAGSTFSINPGDAWNIEVSAHLASGATYPDVYGYVGFWGAIFYNQTFEPELPPGATGIEIDGDPESALSVTLAYDAAPSPPSYALHALSDFAGSTGILGDFAIHTNLGHYPYADLTAMSPAPFGGRDLDNLHSIFHALPSSLLDATVPFADAVVPPDGGATTIYRAQNCTFSTVYTITYPRYRFIFADIPIRRVYPRRLEVRSVYPPPTTQQYGRRTGSAAPL